MPVSLSHVPPEPKRDSSRWMKVRTFRAPDEEWEPALAKAEAEGTTLTAVLREALRQYAGSKDESDSR